MEQNENIRKVANGFTITCVSMFFVLIVWNATLDISNFFNQQTALAKHSASSAANEIELLIKGYKRSVTIFVDENTTLIGNVAEWPQDINTYATLKDKVVKHFPEQFTFTIANGSGVTLLEGFEGLVGDNCRREIDEFTTSGGGGSDQRTYIHRGRDSLTAHFDIMARWKSRSAEENVFFISFKPDSLERILEHTRVPGHRILLVSSKQPSNIETAIAEDLRHFSNNRVLTEKQLGQISHSLFIPRTNWNVVILPEENLYRSNYFSVLLQSLVVLAGVLIISLIARMMLLDEHQDKKQG